MMAMTDSIGQYKIDCAARKATEKYWMNKGCSYWKAQKLIERYGLKYALIRKFI